MIEAIAGGLVTVFLEKALGYSITKNPQGGYDLKHPDGTITTIQPRSLKSAVSIPKRLTASSNSRPTSPTYSFSNPVDAIILLLSLDMIPQVSSRQYLEIAVAINTKILFDSTNGGKDTGFFTDLDSFALPLPVEGLDFLPAKTIDIYVWSNTVAQTPIVTISGLVGSYDN